MSEFSEKCQTSSASSAGSSKSLGVQKFCSKLRHKIEDNLNLNSARLTNKLRKSSRHSMSMSALSGIADATTGKYTTTKSATKTKTLQQVPASGMLKYKRVVKKSGDDKKPEGSKSDDMKTAHKEISSSVYVDSDDEYQLPSLSWTQQSLEDEIFEELEKAAHDENKLNSVLKSFDRILTDFHDETIINKIENHVVENAENAYKINNLESDNDTIMKAKLETNQIPHKLSKARTTLCEQNLPKKLTTSSKLNKSVLDVANTPTTITSKIPIWKALPLSKRSKSFCYAPPAIIEAIAAAPAQKPIALNPINISMGKRAISYTTLPRHKQATQRAPLKYNNYNSNKLIKSKTELNVKMKPQQYKNPITKSTTQKCGNLRSHTNSDELLDKCMEKGKQILRKIETLGEKGARLKKSINKEIITEETKNVDMLKKEPGTKTIDPKYLADKGRQNSDALSDDSGHISNETDVNQTNGLCESSSSTLESLCDIEIDTAQQLNTIAATSTPTTRSTKIIKLLQKFENSSTTTKKTTAAAAAIPTIVNKKSNLIKKATTTTTTKTENNFNTQFTQNICTSLKVSEVEAVHCVETHIEIFPNYSKEVTTWFY